MCSKLVLPVGSQHYYKSWRVRVNVEGSITRRVNPLDHKKATEI